MCLHLLEQEEERDRLPLMNLEDGPKFRFYLMHGFTSYHVIEGEEAAISITRLRKYVCRALGLPNHVFYLLHAGRALDRGTIASNNIRPGDTIQVMIRGLGGGLQAEARAPSRFPEGSSARTTPEEGGAGISQGKLSGYDHHGCNGPAGL